MDSDVIAEVYIARNEAVNLARQAADTVQGVLARELVSEGCVESALAALEDARNELLRIEVMVEHNKYVSRS